MAIKKPFIARHGVKVGTTTVFGSNGKLHANNTISNGTITDAMLSGSTGSNLSKVQQVEQNLLSTNTAVRAYTDTAVANLVDSAPGTLDTLNELAAALGDDANYAATVTTNLGTKATWDALLATNTAIRSTITSNDTDISALWTALTATNTAIRSTITSNDGDISNLQTEDSNLWSAVTATNTAIRSLISSNDTDISNLQTEDSDLWTGLKATNTAIRSLISSNDTDISNLQSSVSSNDTDISALQTRATNLEGTDIGVTLTGAVTGSGTITNLGDVSISTTATNDPTLTLSGDVSGSATFTNLGNATLSATVANDSHNHSSSSGAFTVGGDLTVSGGDISLSGTGRIQGVDTVSAGTDAANKTYVDNKVANLVDSSPAALDTLNELAAALGDDENFATTVSTNLGQKLGATASVALTGDVTGSASFSANAVSVATSLASGSVGTSELAADCVTAAKIGNDVINSEHYAAGSIDNEHLAADCVNGSKIANDSINSEHYVDGSIDAAHLASNSVTAAKIAANSVDSSELVDNSVDASHLNVSGNGTSSQFLRSDGDGSFSWATPTDTNTTYSVGDGGLTQKNFTTTLKSKLDGIAEGATNVTNNNQLTNGAGYITSYVNTTYSAGAGLDLTGTTFSVESDLRGEVTLIGADTNDYYQVGTTTHKWFLDGAEDMRLTNNGQLDVEGSVVAHSSTVSDRNLKEDIQPIENALEKVNTLTGCTYSYKKDGRKSAGLIAQDVQEVLPSAVTKTEIMNIEGEHLVLEYDQVHGLLVEAIKTLTAKVEELENVINNK